LIGDGDSFDPFGELVNGDQQVLGVAVRRGEPFRRACL
jgi:hypothetical protein